MIVVVFRTRLRPEAAAEYGEMAIEMSELAKAVPGHVSHKGFLAADGEKATIVEFETQKALDAWRRDRDHLRAKKAGRESFFSEYKYQICDVTREHRWKLPLKE